MLVHLLEHAFEEVFGADAINAQLRDFGFHGRSPEFAGGAIGRRTDAPEGKRLFGQGIGQAIAIRLARNYCRNGQKITYRKSVISWVQASTNNGLDDWAQLKLDPYWARTFFPTESVQVIFFPPPMMRDKIYRSGHGPSPLLG